MYPEFIRWLDRVLAQPIPAEVVAFVFNLYEGEDSSFHVQLAGCPTFDKDSDEWAASDIFTTGEDLCFIPRASFGDDWSKALIAVREMIVSYLAEGAQSKKLMRAKAVAVGFVDGDLDVIHPIA